MDKTDKFALEMDVVYKMELVDVSLDIEELNVKFSLVLEIVLHMELVMKEFTNVLVILDIPNLIAQSVRILPDLSPPRPSRCSSRVCVGFRVPSDTFWQTRFLPLVLAVLGPPQTIFLVFELQSNGFFRSFGSM